MTSSGTFGVVRVWIEPGVVLELAAVVATASVHVDGVSGYSAPAPTS
jgi:hypothetical protein